MTSLSLYFKGWALALSMLMLAAGSATAQQADSLRVESSLRSFKIKDGAVFIDGRKVSPEKLPEGFPPEGASAFYMFSPGLDADLKIQIEDGKQYVLDGDTLKLYAHSSPRAFGMRFRSPRFGGGYFPDPPVLFIPSAPPEAILERKAKDLLEKARRMQDLQRRFDASRANELQRMAEEMTLHAEDAARAASEFPHIHMRRYFSDIQHKNKGLFEQLMSERRMERETARRARRVAAMEEGKARRDSTEALRDRLDEIFELKQENRRREVDELKERLQELQATIGERQRLQRDIVDRRLQELLGDDTLDW